MVSGRRTDAACWRTLLVIGSAREAGDAVARTLRSLPGAGAVHIDVLGLATPVPFVAGFAFPAAALERDIARDAHLGLLAVLDTLPPDLSAGARVVRGRLTTVVRAAMAAEAYDDVVLGLPRVPRRLARRLPLGHRPQG